MKEQHCYLIKPEKTVMANKKKLHQQFRNRQSVLPAPFQETEPAR